MGFKPNPLTVVDSYKFSHRKSYIPGTQSAYANLTPRSVKHLNLGYIPSSIKDQSITWLGGQAAVKDLVELWDEEFFQKDIEQIISTFVHRVTPFTGPDYAVDHIRKLHALGYLPLRIKTLPEGSRVPVGVPVLTTRSTQGDDFAWLTNYIESALSAEIWGMSTSATTAYYLRKVIEHYAERTGGSKEFIDFQGHDFSLRGQMGIIAAARSGIGHLLYFKGTDTVTAVEYAAYHYSGDETFMGASVPATEHSVQCSYRDDYQYFKHLVTEVYPTGIVSLVSDGYDYWNVLTSVIPSLKEEIMSRQVDGLGFAKVVVRPDSGTPEHIIAGYEPHEVEWSPADNCYYLLGAEPRVRLSDAEVKGSVQVLWETFGGTENGEGFRTLDSHIGLIYGDSITISRANEILSRLARKGFASDNIVLGIGSMSYQYVTRDTLGFAIKATYIEVNGQGIELFKDPVTDTDKTKKSAKGLLKVERNEDGVFVLKDQVSEEEEATGELTVLFEDGKFLKHQKFAEIREVAKSYF